MWPVLFSNHACLLPQLAAAMACGVALHLLAVLVSQHCCNQTKKQAFFTLSFVRLLTLLAPAALFSLITLLLLQVVTLLECFSACGVSPQPQTVDHLVLQLVQGGLQHAPVAGIAQLLSVLAATQHNPGLLFVKNYAYVSGLDHGRQLSGMGRLGWVFWHQAAPCRW
jgi:hypothetical protein